ncbi:hypothetical protein [Providencia sp. 2024EL-00732]|uniref:hypothetical protein n=1 Tax=Providencia sp. 2024EL-00732 TaxID=3374242 RepID=UPI0037564A94
MQTDNDKLFNEICYFKFKLNEILEKENNIYKDEKNGKTFIFSFWSWYRTVPLSFFIYIILTIFFVFAATQANERSELIFIVIALAFTLPIICVFSLDIFKLFNNANRTLKLQEKINNLLNQYNPYNEEQFSLLKDKLQKTQSTIVYNHFLNEWISIEFRCKPCKSKM